MLLAFLIVLMLTLPVSPAFAADPPPEAVSAHFFGTDAPFAGRLYVESIGVDVALYRTLSQEAVDRVDSAAYFDLGGARGHMIIADHCTQAFRNLGKVKTGSTACVVAADGSTAYYECTAIFKGHNTGGGITDWQGNSVIGQSDLLMYTCFDGWRNVWVVLWIKTVSPEELASQQLLTRFGDDMDALINELLQYPASTSTSPEEIELTLHTPAPQ